MLAGIQAVPEPMRRRSPPSMPLAAASYPPAASSAAATAGGIEIVFQSCRIGLQPSFDGPPSPSRTDDIAAMVALSLGNVVILDELTDGTKPGHDAQALAIRTHLARDRSRRSIH